MNFLANPVWQPEENPKAGENSQETCNIETHHPQKEVSTYRESFNMFTSLFENTHGKLHLKHISHHSFPLAAKVPLTQHQMYIPYDETWLRTNISITCRILKSFHIMLYLNLDTNLWSHVYSVHLEPCPAGRATSCSKCKALVHESTRTTQLSIFLPWERKHPP